MGLLFYAHDYDWRRSNHYVYHLLFWWLLPNDMPLKQWTFLAGFAWLVYGALFFGYGDWDIPVSILMAGFTYFCADWCWNAWRNLEWRKWPATVLATWWCVDGVYWLYWSQVNPDAMFREGQWQMSLCLFLLCGVIWSRGDSAIKTVKAIYDDLRRSRSCA